MSSLQMQLLFERFEREMRVAQADMPVPGIAAAVLVGDRIEWTHAVGNAAFDPDVPLTPDHVFRIGSITKLFTAHAVMILHEEGRLSLDDPVRRYVPEFDPQGPEVTIRHILCHGSGIPSDGGLGIWESGIYPDEAEFRSQIRAYRCAAPPMVHLKYSNAAYSMLGLVIAAASGQPHERFVLERVVAPLGMEDTSFHPDPALGARLAKGYYMPPFERRFAPAIHHELKAFAPCGLLASTPADVLKLARMYWAGPDIVSPEGRAEMLRTHLMDGESPNWELGYGLGWRKSRVGERVFDGHSGSYPGFLCVLEMSPKDRVAVALFANYSRARSLISLALDWLRRVCEIAPPQVRPAGAEEPPQAWRRLLGHYYAHRRYEMRIEYRDGGLRMMGGHYPGEGVPLREITSDRFLILSGRGVGEEVVVLRRDAEGRATEITICGELLRRI